MRVARGILYSSASLYLGLCLWTYSKWDPSFFTYSPDPVRNKGGIVGAYLSDILMTAVGIASYAIPVFLAVYGIKGVLLRERHKINLAGALVFMLSLSSLAALAATSPGWGLEAGLAGKVSARLFSSLLSVPGAYILFLALLLSSLVLLSPAPIIHYLFKIGDKKQPKEKAKEPETVAPVSDAGAYLRDENVPEVFAAIETVSAHDEPAVESLQDFPAEADEEAEAGGLNSEADRMALEAELLGLSSYEGVEEAAGEDYEESGYELPPIELLLSHPSDAARPSSEETVQDSLILERRLADFGVQGKVTQAHSGPVVTMYEFEPAPGVKITRVVSLSEDLALGLKAKSVRIAPIPGKSTLGIEVPNRERESVSLKEILSADVFRRSASKLTLALGKDIFGNPILADLTRMPHLLVAGATGAGKSVALNSMVMSVLYKASPNDAKMLLIDPKLLELSAYEGIPHLISPVITSPKEASSALKKIVFEMDRRYRLLADRGAKNIDGFNASASKEERLPYIMVVIDELADLMYTSASEVEDSIARLAQMARASGIHLILATQRPSVDVITGVIKANFPARISFQVTSKIDSRTILDGQGAEQLIGKGDMLFMLPGSRTLRVHGALVTEPEIGAVTRFIKAQGTPDYSILESIAAMEEERESSEAERDEMYQRAIEFAESAGEVSISSIQRRLRVGYNRAARIMELMEEDGLVGPPRGAGKPRDFIRRR